MDAKQTLQELDRIAALALKGKERPGANLFIRTTNTKLRVIGLQQRYEERTGIRQLNGGFFIERPAIEGSSRRIPERKRAIR